MIDAHGLTTKFSSGNSHQVRDFVATLGGRFVHNNPEYFCRLSREERGRLVTRAIKKDSDWEREVSNEVKKFTGELTVTLGESRMEGSGRRSYSACGKTVQQRSGLNGDFPSGRPCQDYEDPADHARWVLEKKAIDAAEIIASHPSAPSNRVHHDHGYGSYTTTDSMASLEVKVTFLNGEISGTQIGVPESRQYSNI